MKKLHSEFLLIFFVPQLTQAEAVAYFEINLNYGFDFGL